MMINNYNCVKEFDITNENIEEVKFYIRPWQYCTEFSNYLDVVVEMEILLIDG